jgi:hypothetical protein
MRLANFAAVDPSEAGRGLTPFGVADGRVGRRVADEPVPLVVPPPFVLHCTTAGHSWLILVERAQRG